jgi:biotin carboxyl carrier protein
MNITAPLQATVVEWLVAAGDAVTKDQTIVILEAMKMEHEIKAEFDERLLECLTNAGDLVQQGEVLATINNEPNIWGLTPLGLAKQTFAPT